MALKRSRLRLPHQEYKKLCLLVHERDKWRCQVPGCKSRNNLHAHHIIYRSHQGNDSSDNLITMCDSCHSALHDRRIVIKPLVPGEPVDADEGVLFEFIDFWSPRKIIKYESERRSHSGRY